MTRRAHPERRTTWRIDLPRCQAADKTSYTKAGAKQQLKRSQTSPDSTTRSIYRCEHCQHYHLTSRPPR